MTIRLCIIGFIVTYFISIFFHIILLKFLIHIAMCIVRLGIVVHTAIHIVICELSHYDSHCGMDCKHCRCVL